MVLRFLKNEKLWSCCRLLIEILLRVCSIFAWSFVYFIANIICWNIFFFNNYISVWASVRKLFGFILPQCLASNSHVKLNSINIKGFPNTILKILTMKAIIIGDIIGILFILTLCTVFILFRHLITVFCCFNSLFNSYSFK